MLPLDWSLHTFESTVFDGSWNSFFEVGSHHSSVLQTNLLSSQLRILDYKLFKAARTIQRYFRGWHVRNYMEKRRKAAIVIQKIWRKYIFKPHLIVEAEEQAQISIVVMFNTSAITIQKVFRGWWLRKNVHDMNYLNVVQLKAVEDILFCMIRKMHTFKRSGYLPGILSFDDKECFTKIESLLKTMSYRFYNRHVGIKWASNEVVMEEYRAHHLKNVNYTKVPYKGSECNSQFNLISQGKSYDRSEYDFAQIFMTAKRRNESIFKIHNPVRTGYSQKNYSKFCKDLLKSMQRWTVCVEKEMFMEDDKGIDKFLSDLKEYLETINYIGNCFCKEPSAPIC